MVGGEEVGSTIMSSGTGGRSIGRDMLAAARLITCGGSECQAVSRHRAGQPNSHRTTRYRLGWEREEEKGERTEKCRHDAAFPAPQRGRHAVPRCREGPAYGGAGGRLL